MSLREIVDAVGSDVTAFRVGDRVFGYSEDLFGAHAEYMTMPEAGPRATMPANVTFEEAAPSTEGSHYALSAIRAAKIQSGQDVLVHGATGAIGSAAVQLLKSLGANVTATSDTANVEVVPGLGADRDFDHTAQDFTKDAQRYDVVLDAVGKTRSPMNTMLNRGIYLHRIWVRPSESDLRAGHAAHWRQKVLFPIPKHDQEMIKHFREIIESGQFKPLIDGGICWTRSSTPISTLRQDAKSAMS